MRLPSSAFFLLASFAPCIALGQTPVSAPPPPAKTPSAIMQPALDSLRQTLGTLRPDKWKASGAVREQAGANIGSIQRDLETTLPPLLATADRAPNSVAQVLPAYRNIEALYDVLLRVAEAGSLSAPSDQNAALENVRAALESGRRTLGDSLHDAALAQEKQISDLQAAARATPPAPAPVACPPPPSVKKRKPRKKTTKKPAPAPASSPSPATASH
jgi:hypothetical protein